MKLTISNNQKLSDIKDQFSELFPFLKLEFFHNPPITDEALSIENRITDPAKTLGAIGNVDNQDEISFNGLQKASTLEQHFNKHFGINAQVFRKSGNAWLLTTTSDEHTLNELNAKGEESQIPFNPDKEFEDIHEQE